MVITFNFRLNIMSAGSFKQDGLNWRFNLIKQKFGEWIEYQTSQLNLNPAWDWKSWQSSLLWQIIRFCLWSTIAILLVWMTWQLWLLLRPYVQRWRRLNDQPTSLTPLLETPQLSSADWVERSQSARLEGNYRQAIFYLYQGMLKLLDERSIIPSQHSLTDEEYRRSLIKISTTPVNPYELLLLTHQKLCFSQAEADRALFEECLQAYQQIAS
jgi:hypothetical protein